MATVLETIRKAYRRGGVKAAGVNLNATDFDVGLERLQDMYQTMAEGMFGRRTDKYLTSATAYEAAEFERVINTAAATVTLPATVRDPVTGDDRTPRDGAIITVTVPGVDPDIYIYESDLAEWQNIRGMVLFSRAPLTNRWADGIADILAVLIADDVGYPVSNILAKRAGLAKLSMASRYGSERRTTPSEYF